MTDRLLTVSEAGRRLAKHGYRLTALIRQEQIGYVKQGSVRRIPESEVERIEAGHQDGAA